MTKYHVVIYTKSGKQISCFTSTSLRETIDSLHYFLERSVRHPFFPASDNDTRYINNSEIVEVRVEDEQGRIM